MTKLRITQVRSIIRTKKRQKRTLDALGLHGIRSSVVHDDTPQIRGMLQKVPHLVSVEEEQ